MEEVENNYYESLLQRGINLNSCIMVHNAYWSYFTELNFRYPNVSIHTFGRGLYYLDSQVRKYPNDYCYEIYDLFLLSSNGGYDESDLEELEELAEKMSINKRITFGYYYPVAHQGCCSYIIESYFNGNKNFSDSGVLEKHIYDSFQMINLMAEKHMELISKENNEEREKNENLKLDLNLSNKK